MISDLKKLNQLNELRKSIPSEWISGNNVDFPEIIYMKLNEDKISALQASYDLINELSLSTTGHLLDYIVDLHSIFPSLVLDVQSIPELKTQLNTYQEENKKLKESIEKLKVPYKEKSIFQALKKFFSFFLDKSKIDC